uniref:Uncharacterized protein n=1 Tax=Amphimedon queenslandica TaxID=400682 RepID=A0A1X7UNU9_AMPQE
MYILVVVFQVLLVADTSSACMTDGCSSCTTSNEPSLYHQYCCLPANNGKKIKKRDNDLLIMFFCPVDGLSDPICETVRVYQSCKETLENNPNAVSGYYNIITKAMGPLSKCTVIWRVATVMVLVAGLEWLIST